MKPAALRLLCALLLGLSPNATTADQAAGDLPPVVDVEGQPLAANAERLTRALEFLGSPLPADLVEKLAVARRARDAEAIQRLLDPRVVFIVELNPEVRVKARRGPGAARLRQGGFTPLLIKVLNDATVTPRLRMSSPQAGPVYAGASPYILGRQAQTELARGENADEAADRFLEVEVFRSPPMTERLSGLEVEYAIALLYSIEAGRREATIGFDVGAGTQDIGFRGETPVLFDIAPSKPVRLSIRDVDGSPTVARLTFRDRLGHVFPPQAKRVAPDFFFQPQVYRRDGDTVLLPPGELALEASRGPEYATQRRTVQVPADACEPTLEIALERWVDPSADGWYSGDHHIHGAGCSHYTSPTEGVTPADMFLQVKGEGLNVGCVLTWGPCFEFQRRYFAPDAHEVSEPLTVIKYDLEISGFGSEALGHVCLLGLRDQTYPGSDGTKTRGWPTWTVPVLRWCKEQGGVTGFPHSALSVDPTGAARRLLAARDVNRDERIDVDEAMEALLPEPFERIDEDRDGALVERELRRSMERASTQLPNLVVPEMDGAGAMEICVAVAEGVCDFVSAMNTPRISEWNTWYHLLNCGFPLKVSGETDFPCMSGRRVGQGRVYVQLGKEIERLDFDAWCRGLAAGRSYVSDGFAHALAFDVDGVAPGFGRVSLEGPTDVTIRARVAFASEVPRAVAHGTLLPASGRRTLGDTVDLHAPRSDEVVRGGSRLVEIVLDGEVVASREVPADAAHHEIELSVPVTRSGWIALRQFPQLHTNPVEVIVAGAPIRASRRSALWCIEVIELLWRNRQGAIASHEREAARAAYDRAVVTFRRIAAESP